MDGDHQRKQIIVLESLTNYRRTLFFLVVNPDATRGSPLRSASAAVNHFSSLPRTRMDYQAFSSAPVHALLIYSAPVNHFSKLPKSSCIFSTSVSPLSLPSQLSIFHLHSTTEKSSVLIFGSLLKCPHLPLYFLCNCTLQS